MWFPQVPTSDHQIAVSNNISKSKGIIASPYLKPLLTIKFEDKCLPVLTMAHISIFKILYNLTNFFGKPSLSISFHISFLHKAPYDAWKSIKRWCTSIFCSQHFSNTCLIVKNLINSWFLPLKASLVFSYYSLTIRY